MALRMAGLLFASSNLLIITSHLVDWQMCFEEDLIGSEKNVSPATRSTFSTNEETNKNHKNGQKHRLNFCLLGTTKLSKGAVSGMGAFGRTNAPVASSYTSGVDGDVGFAVSTTFAKCVGTAMLGGEPITSCV